MRSGGEEFLILLPQIDEGIPLKVAERIRRRSGGPWRRIPPRDREPGHHPDPAGRGSWHRAGPGGRVALSGQAGGATGWPTMGTLRGAQ